MSHALRRGGAIMIVSLVNCKLFLSRVNEFRASLMGRNERYQAAADRLLLLSGPRDPIAGDIVRGSGKIDKIGAVTITSSVSTAPSRSADEELDRVTRSVAQKSKDAAVPAK